jgi:hypothetical protein
MADATHTTDNPVADLEINSDADDNKTVSNPGTEAALEEALRAEGFNPDGSAYEPKSDDIQPKDKKDAAPGPTGPTGTAGDPGATGAPAATGATGATGASGAPADEFDAIELPPHTKPKTGEAFGTVKALARQRIAAIQKERDELKEKLDAADKLSKDLPEDTKKELEELRKFRQQMDVEADPTFKEYDTKSASNLEAIYSKLTDNKFNKDAIDKIKELGGPANVDWDKLAADGRITPGLKRFIDGKLFENDDLVEKKKQAIDAAKKNAAEFLKKREEETVRSADSSATETNKEWTTEIVPNMDLFRTEKFY